MADTSQDNIIKNFDDLPASIKSVISANAASKGITPQQYIDERGGVEATTKKFGDSYNPEVDLTAAEYAAVMADVKSKGLTGTSIGEAINAATAAKRGISLYEYTGGIQGTPTKSNAKVLSKTVNEDGNTVIKYSNGTVQIQDANGNVLSTNFTGSKTGTQSTSTASLDAEEKAKRQSAYDLLYAQFKQYGLESLVEGIKDLIQKDVSPSQFTIELRNSPAYLKRFAANAARVKAGYKALDEGTYLALEDSYQNLMRNYGLPASYWEKGELGVQPGFEKLIAGNVDPVELEQRLVQAVDQIEKGPKEYMDAIKQFYPEISRSDLLSYVLDPENALKTIQSKVKAAQIGGEYLRAGLGTDVTRASELATQGVTADIARASIPTIMETAKRGGELAGFYGNAGLGLYDQATAEEEIYNLGKAAEAKKKREKLVGLEQASFAGQYGGAQGALDRGRSGAY